MFRTTSTTLTPWGAAAVAVVVVFIHAFSNLSASASSLPLSNIGRSSPPHYYHRHRHNSEKEEDKGFKPWITSSQKRKLMDVSNIHSLYSLRGGSDDADAKNVDEKKDNEEKEEEDGENDEDRYSRQYYTLGARAHGLVRSSIIALDGPATSGLTYECAKNLALSGVGHIILITENYDEDNKRRLLHEFYHDSMLDDLGRAYGRAARKELGWDDEDEKNHNGNNDVKLLQLFLQRLNPSLVVSTMKRTNLIQLLEQQQKQQQHDTIDFSSMVVLCVDRPISTQLQLNQACRYEYEQQSNHIPFVSAGTAGVYGQIFCDFGSNFHVMDEDGESPRITLLQTLQQIPHHNDHHHHDHHDDSLIRVHCIEGERHEVSKGDDILFHFSGQDEQQQQHNQDDMTMMDNVCQVCHVQNPTCFTVRRRHQQHQNNPESIHQFIQRVINSPSSSKSFSRVKYPRHVPFISLTDAIQSIRQDHEDAQSLYAPSDLDKSFDPIRRLAISMSFLLLDQFITTIRNNHNLNNSMNKEQQGDKFTSFVLGQLSSHKTNTNKGKEFTNIVSRFGRGAPARLAPMQALYGALGAQEALKAVTGLYNPVKQFLLYDCEEILLSSSSNDNNNTNDEMENKDDYDDSSMLAHGQTYILGSAFTSKLSSKRLFIAGSGAIGCEILKNLSAMINHPSTTTTTTTSKKASSSKGKIIVTDMDTIERSNLSRQLLFRDINVGDFKSMAARLAILRFNPNLHIEAHTSKVGHDNNNDNKSSSSSLFHDEFWSKHIDIILNALDNIEARLFMDSKCISHYKSLIDAGTLGSKGNVQVVIPGLSESYGSSVDPPEPSIPICTLKHFPHDISHTIQWGRDLFDGFFRRRPNQWNDHIQDFLSNGSENGESGDIIARRLVQTFGEEMAMTMVDELMEDITFITAAVRRHNDNPNEDDTSTKTKSNIIIIREMSLKWAAELANQYFQMDIQQLLRQHPPDSLDEDGEPFWTGTRRLPKVLSYNDDDDDDSFQNENQSMMINRQLIDFVRYAARLRIETILLSSSMDDQDDDNNDVDNNHYGGMAYVSEEEAIAALKASSAKTTTTTTTADHSSPPPPEDIVTFLAEKLSTIQQQLQQQLLPSSIPSQEQTATEHHNSKILMTPIEFEKDDDTNGHVSFVNAASNLRALAYNIKPVDFMETRRVAGRIVPAMITTTAFVSALSCIELIKLVQNPSSSSSSSSSSSLQLHKNAFVNLALPFFAFTSPLPAEEMMGPYGQSYTLWDRILIKEGKKKSAASAGITMKRFLKKVLQKAKPSSKHTYEDVEEDVEEDSVQVSSVSYGPYMLYANFLHEDDDSILNKSIWDIVKEAITASEDDDEFMSDRMDNNYDDDDAAKNISMENIDEKTYLDLSVIVEDVMTGEEMELPPVRVIRWKK